MKRLALSILLIGLAAFAAGCADEACFQWTKAEGACPAQKDALQFFGCNGGPDSIQSVDSEGTFSESEGLCCYSVTKRSSYTGCPAGNGL